MRDQDIVGRIFNCGDLRSFRSITAEDLNHTVIGSIQREELYSAILHKKV